MAARTTPGKQTKATKGKTAGSPDSIRLLEIKELTIGTGKAIDFDAGQLYRNALAVLDIITPEEFELIRNVKEAGQIDFGTEFYSDNAGALRSLNEIGLIGLVNSGSGLVSSLQITELAKVVIFHNEKIEEIRKDTARQNDFLYGKSGLAE